MTNTNKTKRSGLLALIALGVLAFPAVAGATTTSSDVSSTAISQAPTAAAEDLVVRVDEVLNSIELTYYSYDNIWTPMTGVYKTNCSQYAAHVLDEATPVAFDAVTGWCDCNWPNSGQWVSFLKTITPGTTKNHWTRVAKVKDMRPGDVFVEKYNYSASSTGHTMIVVSTPVLYSTNVYKVRVSDSAKSGHSSDNRGSSGSGIGAGYILIKAGSSSGAPIAYKWSLGSSTWHSDSTFAIGHPA